MRSRCHACSADFATTCSTATTAAAAATAATRASIGCRSDHGGRGLQLRGDHNRCPCRRSGRRWHRRGRLHSMEGWEWTRGSNGEGMCVRQIWCMRAVLFRGRCLRQKSPLFYSRQQVYPSAWVRPVSECRSFFPSSENSHWCFKESRAGVASTLRCTNTSRMLTFP